MYDLAESLLVRLAGRNSFQCMAWQPIHCEFVTGQCILPEREYVWQGRQVIPASSPIVIAFLKETYFWDNFDYNVRCYDFGYETWIPEFRERLMYTAKMMNPCLGTDYEEVWHTIFVV